MITQEKTLFAWQLGKFPMKLQLRFYSNVKKTVEASVAKNRIVESLAKNDAMEPGIFGRIR